MREKSAASESQASEIVEADKSFLQHNFFTALNLMGCVIQRTVEVEARGIKDF